ncbi:MAG: hypothetical protein ACOCTG_06960, partial [Bacteroidota bacterium]
MMTERQEEPSDRAVLSVFAVEDHELFREMLTTFLGQIPGLRVTATAASAEEALRVLPDLSPSVASV